MPPTRLGCGRVPVWEQDQGLVGPPGVMLPGAGLSGGRAEQISTSSLPCSLCLSGGQGLGRGWDCLLLWGCLWTHTSCSLPGRGRGEGRLGAGQQAKGWLENFQLQEESSISKPVASSFGDANKVLNPAAVGSTDVLLLQKPREPLP